MSTISGETWRMSGLSASADLLHELRVGRVVTITRCVDHEPGVARLCRKTAFRPAAGPRPSLASRSFATGALRTRRSSVRLGLYTIISGGRAGLHSSFR